MAPPESEGCQFDQRASPEDDVYSMKTALGKFSASNSTLELVSQSEYEEEQMALAECCGANPTRVTQSEDEEERCDRGIVLDEGTWGNLHDYILEKIIARLPMKLLFQAATLSKSWKLSFHSDSFQSEIEGSAAASWKAYAPLYVSRKKELVGYESSSQRWHVLPAHSYLQQHAVDNWRLRAGAGGLLFWTSETYLKTSCIYEYHVNVTNPLTRSMRQLPTRPNMQYPALVHVVCEGTEGYKVILVTLRPNICLQIFDSTSGAWTLDSQDTFSAQNFGPIVFIDNVLYMILVSRSWNTTCQLISFDVKKNIWTEIPHLRNGREREHPFNQYSFECVGVCEVCVCGSDVMLVVSHRDHFVDPEHDGMILEKVSVFELDLERGVAVEVSTFPKEMTDVAFDFCNATAHGDCIHICGPLPTCPSIVYNLRTKEWHWVDFAPVSLTLSCTETNTNKWFSTNITYQPGLHPFLEV